MNAHSKDSFEYTMAFKQVSSGLHLTVLTPSSESSLNLTPSFKVTQSSFKVSSQNLIEKINYDHRIGKRNDLNEVVFSYYLKKEEVRKKGVYYTNNTIDTFSIIPVLQAISKHSPEAFSADFVVQHMALKVPVVIQKVISNNLLPFLMGTHCPRNWKHIFDQQKNHILYMFCRLQVGKGLFIITVITMYFQMIHHITMWGIGVGKIKLIYFLGLLIANH